MLCLHCARVAQKTCRSHNLRNNIDLYSSIRASLCLSDGTRYPGCVSKSIHLSLDLGLRREAALKDDVAPQKFLRNGLGGFDSEGYSLARTSPLPLTHHPDIAPQRPRSMPSEINVKPMGGIMIRNPLPSSSRARPAATKPKGRCSLSSLATVG